VVKAAVEALREYPILNSTWEEDRIVIKKRINIGIAVDIDPDRNPCCGCVQPWPEHPACQGDAESVFDRTELPRCWIYAFERYGFYWLGRDPHLRDTMHFEFLGDPSRILTR